MNTSIIETIDSKVCDVLKALNKNEVNAKIDKSLEQKMIKLHIVDSFWKVWSDNDIAKLECWLRDV